MAKSTNYLFPVRLLLGIGIVLGILASLFLLLLLVDTALSVWERLETMHPWVARIYLGALLIMGALGGVLVWRLMRPRRRAVVPPTPPVPDEAAVQHKLEQAQAAGLQVQDAQHELRELTRRRAAGTVYVALFGEISSGKSSLIKALLPDASVSIDPRGGTTRTISHYTWTSPSGDRLVLTDMPGLNEADGTLDDLASEEALRAHLVIYVCESDLTRNQCEAIKTLLSLSKPLILALNKMDQYAPEELAAVEARLRERLDGAQSVEVLAVSAGGSEEIIRVHPDGREERVVRARPARVDALREAVQRHIDADPKALDELRDAAVFVLTSQKLDRALNEHRRDKSDELVRTYTRRAVIGALAAVAPGTDLAIQGYLGMRLIKELCGLYDVPVRSLDLQRFLENVSSQVGKTVPILMTVAGNAFKAFPGIGTLAGGLIHAVAYGLIFDSLGRAVARTLESRGTFAPAPALRLLEEDLGEDLESRARRIAQIALEARSTERHAG